MALDLGGLTPILYAFIERDEIVEMLASITGQRMLFNYFRIGGVNGDLNHEFMSRLGDWMSRALVQVEANAGLLNENEIFVRRMRGIGMLDHETALRMGVTGPNLRAAGVPFDIRRAHPYSVYPELEFDIPTRGTEGRRRLPRPLPAAPRRDQGEPADHRPVPPQHARRTGHGPPAAPAPAAPGSGLGRRRGTRAACSGRTRSRTAPTSRSGSRSTTRPSSTCSSSALLDEGQPDRGHDGRHVVARPDHGRHRQVGRRTAQPRLGQPRPSRQDPRPAAVPGARRRADRDGAGRATFVGPFLVDVLGSNMGIVRFVVAITGVLLFSIPAAFIIIYMELKVIAFMNLRIGPEPGRAGGRGALGGAPGSRC